MKKKCVCFIGIFLCIGSLFADEKRITKQIDSASMWLIWKIKDVSYKVEVTFTGKSLYTKGDILYFTNSVDYKYSETKKIIKSQRLLSEDSGTMTDDGSVNIYVQYQEYVVILGWCNKGGKEVGNTIKVKKDITAPTIKATVNGASYDGKWTTGDVVVSASDAGVGFSYFIVDGTQKNSSKLIFNSSGIYKIVAVDYLGNSSGEFIVKIDKTNPTVKVKTENITSK